MTNVDSRKQMMTEGAAILSKSESEWDQLQQFVSNQNHTGAIRLASAGIERHEQYLNKYSAQLAGDPQTYAMHGRNLVTDYGIRGTQRLMLIKPDSPDRERDLNLAEADIKKALSFPSACYADPGMKANLTEALSLVQEERKGKSGKCFIATAAYGSELAPEVMALRRFRETSLRPHAAGRWFIRCYERCSPPLAAAIAKCPAARLWVRRLLLRPLLALVGPAGDKDRCERQSCQ